MRVNVVRLRTEEKQLLQDPIQYAVVRRKQHSNFHFCLFGLDGDYEGGYYHGILILSPDYPFAPPQLKFFTPSGYFEVDKRVCTTFTDYHRQSWSSMWKIESMVHGVISFMLTGEPSVGVDIKSSQQKRKHAKLSMKRNLENPQFVQIFGKEKFVQDWLKKQQSPIHNKKEKQADTNNQILQQKQIQKQPPIEQNTQTEIVIEKPLSMVKQTFTGHHPNKQIQNITGQMAQTDI